MREPISDFMGRAVNVTLHGSSRSRNADVPGHNVFHGYGDTPPTGDAVDLFGKAFTPVFAIADGRVTQHNAGGSIKEHIYVEGVADGKSYLAVYAHILSPLGPGDLVSAGQQVGKLRDLVPSGPHLHFELWINGASITGSTPGEIRSHMGLAMGLIEDSPSVILARPHGGDFEYFRLATKWNASHDGLVVRKGDVSAVLGTALTIGGTREPIRGLLTANGVTATYETDHLHDADYPRIYVFL
jgi:hypothetical protein